MPWDMTDERARVHKEDVASVGGQGQTACVCMLTYWDSLVAGISRQKRVYVGIYVMRIYVM